MFAFIKNLKPTGKMKVNSFQFYYLCFLLFLCFSSALSLRNFIGEEGEDIYRSQFPDGFLFGTSTSSYQIEGAYLEDGKRLNNWDFFNHRKDGDNGDVADDHYHRKDFVYFAETCFKSFGDRVKYWITINEPNLFALKAYMTGSYPPAHCSEPFGNCPVGNSDVEPLIVMHNMILAHAKAVKLYRDNFQKNQGGVMGIVVTATMYEPLTENERVRTDVEKEPTNVDGESDHLNDQNQSDLEPPPAGMMNESSGHEVHGSDGFLEGDAVESRTVVVDDEEEESQRCNNVRVGDTTRLCRRRALDPLVFGDYPSEMRHYHGKELPSFSAEEIEYVKGSIDFIGLNHYSTSYAKDCLYSSCPSGGDRAIRGFAYITGERNGVLIGDLTGMAGFFVVPRGMEEIVNYVKDRYHNKPMYVLENGYSPPRKQEVRVQEVMNDVKRIEFHKAYLASLARSIRDGADVRGYFVWTLMDSYEWVEGYNITFGLYYIDRKTLERTPKQSALCPGEEGEDINRSQFPDGFFFGTATSSYQIEGAYLEDGKRLNNWDVFNHRKGNINGENGDVADDHYHRYLEDIEILQSLGVNSYRFSISWARILPRGKFGRVNPAGVSFYNKILDSLLLKGIEPFVTIHHHDFPQELEQRYGSWLSPLMQEDFVYFAETCFKSFGDRVKHWITINEPNLFADMAYIRGRYPPAHCSEPFGSCPVGNSDVEPLLAMHNMLLAHGKAAKLYRDHFQVVAGQFRYSLSQMMTGIYILLNRTFDPLIFGDYPPEMRHYHGNELPSFSPEEKEIIKGSIDFIGLNHYSTFYVKDCISSSCALGGDRPIRGFSNTTGYRDGVPIGDRTGMASFFVVPRGMEEIVNYVKDRYHNKPIYVLENGYSPPNQEVLNDVKRIEFHKAYLASLARSIRNGADVRGYFVWTLMDNYEWVDGYGLTFGLYYIDRQTLRRTPKQSALWYRSFLTNTSSCQKEEVMGSSFGNKNVIASGVQAKAASM
ncbi:hypothetical protein RHGRI_018465 [Rhododendron griersonianum]|uniref:Uncharacterized protein n=1 Tax=Rhododendron griersonianum TaxID=479676 RepID=A0AAV6K1J8_9ERIC|nr:hypothetical protein RHGRI_018465 [Rhododendron griersonianum]